MRIWSVGWGRVWFKYQIPEHRVRAHRRVQPINWAPVYRHPGSCGLNTEAELILARAGKFETYFIFNPTLSCTLVLCTRALSCTVVAFFLISWFINDRESKARYAFLQARAHVIHSTCNFLALARSVFFAILPRDKEISNYKARAYWLRWGDVLWNTHARVKVLRDGPGGKVQVFALVLFFSSSSSSFLG